jgi:peptidoglycan/LPS O-acetylase OafA/YrhL
MWIAWIVRRPDACVWPNGAAGVDIFFAISGFVMAVSIPGLRGAPAEKAKTFLWRRFVRILPLYWGITTLKIAILKIWPDVVMNPLGGGWRIAASYLFIPVVNAKGEISPVLGAGWTLNYEILFYVLIALALALDIAPAAFVAPVLVALAGIACLPHGHWPDFTLLASPLLIEFLYGLFFGCLVVRGKFSGRRWGPLLFVASFVALMLIPKPSANLRFLLWGLPAACMLAGAVASEQQWGARLPKWLLEVGDASYALYLCQSLSMSALDHLMWKLHLPPNPALVVEIIVAFAVNIPLALFVHRHFEKPVIAFLKKRRFAQRPPLAADPSLSSQPAT